MGAKIYLLPVGKGYRTADGVYPEKNRKSMSRAEISESNWESRFRLCRESTYGIE